MEVVQRSTHDSHGDHEVPPPASGGRSARPSHRLRMAAFELMSATGGSGVDGEAFGFLKRTKSQFDNSARAGRALNKRRSQARRRLHRCFGRTEPLRLPSPTVESGGNLQRLTPSSALVNKWDRFVALYGNSRDALCAEYDDPNADALLYSVRLATHGEPAWSTALVARIPSQLASCPALWFPLLSSGATNAPLSLVTQYQAHYAHLVDKPRQASARRLRSQLRDGELMQTFVQEMLLAVGFEVASVYRVDLALSLLFLVMEAFAGEVLPPKYLVRIAAEAVSQSMGLPSYRHLTLDTLVDARCFTGALFQYLDRWVETAFLSEWRSMLTALLGAMTPALPVALRLVADEFVSLCTADMRQRQAGGEGRGLASWQWALPVVIQGHQVWVPYHHQTSAALERAYTDAAETQLALAENFCSRDGLQGDNEGPADSQEQHKGRGGRSLVEGDHFEEVVDWEHWCVHRSEERLSFPIRRIPSSAEQQASEPLRSSGHLTRQSSDTGLMVVAASGSPLPSAPSPSAVEKVALLIQLARRGDKIDDSHRQDVVAERADASSPPLVADGACPPSAELFLVTSGGGHESTHECDGTGNSNEAVSPVAATMVTGAGHQCAEELSWTAVGGGRFQEGPCPPDDKHGRREVSSLVAGSGNGARHWTDRIPSMPKKGTAAQQRWFAQLVTETKLFALPVPEMHDYIIPSPLHTINAGGQWTAALHTLSVPFSRSFADPASPRSSASQAAGPIAVAVDHPNDAASSPAATSPTSHSNSRSVPPNHLNETLASFVVCGVVCTDSLDDIPHCGQPESGDAMGEEPLAAPLPKQLKRDLRRLQSSGQWKPAAEDIAVNVTDGVYTATFFLSLPMLLRIVADERLRAVDAFLVAAQLSPGHHQAVVSEARLGGGDGRPRAEAEVLGIQLMSERGAEELDQSPARGAISDDDRDGDAAAEDTADGPLSFTFDVFLRATSTALDALIRPLLVTTGGVGLIRNVLQRMRAERRLRYDLDDNTSGTGRDGLVSPPVGANRHLRVVVETAPANRWSEMMVAVKVGGSTIYQNAAESLAHRSALSLPPLDVSINAALMMELQKLNPKCRVQMPLGGVRPLPSGERRFGDRRGANMEVFPEAEVRMAVFHARPRNRQFWFNSVRHHGGLRAGGAGFPFHSRGGTESVALTDDGGDHASSFYSAASAAHRSASVPLTLYEVEQAFRPRKAPTPMGLGTLLHGGSRAHSSASSVSGEMASAGRGPSPSSTVLQPVGIVRRSKRYPSPTAEQSALEAFAGRAMHLAPDSVAAQNDITKLRRNAGRLTVDKSQLSYDVARGVPPGALAIMRSLGSYEPAPKSNSPTRESHATLPRLKAKDLRPVVEEAAPKKWRTLLPLGTKPDENLPAPASAMKPPQ